MTISDKELFRGIEHLRNAKDCLSGDATHPHDFWRLNSVWTCWLNTHGEELLTDVLELKNENGKLEKSLDMMFVMQDKFKAMRAKYYDLKDSMSVCKCFVTKPCYACGGDGKMQGGGSCGTCKGSGRERYPKCQKCIDNNKP